MAAHRLLAAALLSTGLAAEEFDWGGLPAGEGRQLVYGSCIPCHSLRLVKQQRLSRERWEETLEWMIEEQGMAYPGEQAWEVILDYLATHYGEQRSKP